MDLTPYGVETFHVTGKGSRGHRVGLVVGEAAVIMADEIARFHRQRADHAPDCTVVRVEIGW